MGWPTPDDYDEGAQNLRHSMSDEELRGGQAAVDDQQLPMVWAGSFASVYRINCPATGKSWALKCFTREVSARQERYRQIAAHLQAARLPFTVPFVYLERGVQVHGQWFPAVKMEWVEGQTLNRFVEESLKKPKMLRQLLDLWPKLAARLRDAGIAHADLQHGNVLLVPAPNGKLGLKLIDYDGMFVPSLASTPSGELGHSNYQHPERLRRRVYNGDVDRFSHLVIYTSVRCLSAGQQESWRQFYNGDNLLFREADFAAPQQSSALSAFWQSGDREVRTLIGRLALACGQRLEEVPWLDQVVDQGRALGLTRAEEKQVAALLSGRSASVRAALGAAAATATPPVLPRAASGPPEIARGESAAAIAADAGTQPAAAEGTLPAARPNVAVRAALWPLRRFDRLLAALVGPDNRILHNFLRLVSVGAVLAIVLLAVTLAFQSAPRSRHAVYQVQIEPPKAKLRATGLGVSIEGDGAARTVTIAAPDGRREVVLLATLGGYETLERSFVPWPGQSAALQLQLQPLQRLRDSKPLRLQPLAAQMVEAGKLLTVAVSVEDPDAWKGKVRYALGAQAPPGATIDPQSGAFSWTPSANQAAGQQNISVSAAGAEGQTTQTSFLVTVTRPVLPGKEDLKSEILKSQILIDLANGVKLDMVLIPAGEFLMGSSPKDTNASPREMPQHRVRITKPFYLGKYEVTQEQWEAVMGNNPSYFKGPKNPVEQVSWEDCKAFLDKLDVKTVAPPGKFVLPTEAQWEYACRAGSTTRYCNGDEEWRVGEYAWHNANSVRKTHPVGAKKPNAWGLYDMHGNPCHTILIRPPPLRLINGQGIVPNVS